jgi:nitric oxide reductase NorQ protein
LDLRGLLAAIRMMHRGLPAVQALQLGIVNKCFDDYERQLVSDMIAVRFPGDLGKESIFA